MIRYYLKVSLLMRTDDEDLIHAVPIEQHTAVMGRDTEQVKKFFRLLSRFMGSLQSVFDIKD